MPKLDVIIGKKTTCGTVLSRSGRDLTIICDHGVTFTSRRYGEGVRKSSCPCLRTTSNSKHLESIHSIRTREYNCWRHIRQRCYTPSHKSFKYYGGRGIKVCDRWQDYSNFIQDMGRAPKGFSIDRIDVNGDYEPDNCKWVDNVTQQRNKRTSLYFDFNGQRKHLKQWAIDLGCTYSRLYQRMKKNNSIENIFKGF